LYAVIISEIIIRLQIFVPLFREPLIVLLAVILPASLKYIFNSVFILLL